MAYKWKNLYVVVLITIFHIMIFVGLLNSSNNLNESRNKAMFPPVWTSLQIYAASPLSTDRVNKHHLSEAESRKPSERRDSSNNTVLLVQPSSKAIDGTGVDQATDSESASEQTRPGKLDLDDLINQARAITYKDERPVSQLKGKEPRKLSKEEQFTEDVTKAARPDCRSAYAHMGPIIAPIFLLKDTVTQEGCKW